MASRPEDNSDAELEALEREIGVPGDDYRDHDEDASASPIASAQPSAPLRSQYAQTRQELAKALANRFVHSRTYIFLYLAMAALSVTTVVLSLVEGCPGIAFYVLEIIVNSGMILEVGIRLVAFGKQFWKSPYNYVDIGLTLLCAVTLLVLALSGCSTTSKEEELLDTLLLVARNILQFIRLATVLRKSGRSIFARPTPIDLSNARRAGYSLDIDIFDEDEQLAASDAEAARPLVTAQQHANGRVLFDADGDGEAETTPTRVLADRTKIQGTTDQEDIWASIG